MTVFLEKEMATHSALVLENPVDRGAWWAAIRGVTQSRTRLVGLGSGSSSSSLGVSQVTLPPSMAVAGSLTSLGSGCSETGRGSCRSPKAWSRELAQYHFHCILLVPAEPTERCGWERETEAPPLLGGGVKDLLTFGLPQIS